MTIQKFELLNNFGIVMLFNFVKVKLLKGAGLQFIAGARVRKLHVNSKVH